MAHSMQHHHIKGQCKYMCLDKMDGLERDQVNPRKNTRVSSMACKVVAPKPTCALKLTKELSEHLIPRPLSKLSGSISHWRDLESKFK